MENKKSTETPNSNSETKFPGRKIIYGHMHIVYTWPLLVWTLVAGFLHLVGAEGAWVNWVYGVLMCFVILTLSVDINRDVGMVIGGFVVLLLITTASLSWALKYNLFVAIYRIMCEVGPYFFVGAFLGFLFLVDSVNALLNERYGFQKGEIFKLKWMKRDREFRLEQCISETDTRDVLEAALWGGDIQITEKQTGVFLLLRNVFDFQRVYAEIRKDFPSDKSDMNGGEP